MSDLVQINREDRLVVVTMLEKAGHEVTAVETGDRAVEAVLEGRFDIVLMDVRMPVMNGYESSKGIKAFDPRAKILMVTGHPGDQLARRSVAEGFVASILPKPCTLESLYARVCTVLRG